MASTNILFSILAWSDKSELLFAIAVIFDDIAAAFATVAFVAFISLLVDRAYTANPICTTSFNRNSWQNDFSILLRCFGRLAKWRLGNFFYFNSTYGNSIFNIIMVNEKQA
jgi:PAT family beta-lactamase induction signal transducer AmpG